MTKSVRRPDESMTLLTSMMGQPLDPSYAAAADVREAAGFPRSTGLRSPLVVVAAVVTGLLLSSAALALRPVSTSVTKVRASLVSQIQDRRKVADARAAQVRKLQAQVESAQSNALTTHSQTGLADRLKTLELVSGAQAVTGPGVVVTMDDAKTEGTGSADANPRTAAGPNDGKVLARDVQIVANSLWAAGAEAMAVNGQRLTSRSAIRFAGDAILVNYRPLTRPYRISAIGDPNNVQAAFAEGSGGAYLRSLEDNFGVRASIDSAAKLSLPSATSLTTRVATVPQPTEKTP